MSSSRIKNTLLEPLLIEEPEAPKENKRCTNYKQAVKSSAKLGACVVGSAPAVAGIAVGGAIGLPLDILCVRRNFFWSQVCSTSVGTLLGCTGTAAGLVVGGGLGAVLCGPLALFGCAPKCEQVNTDFDYIVNSFKGPERQSMM